MALVLGLVCHQLSHAFPWDSWCLLAVLPTTSWGMIHKVVFHGSPAGCGAVEEYSSTHDPRSTPSFTPVGTVFPSWWCGDISALEDTGLSAKAIKFCLYCWKFPNTLIYRMLYRCLYTLCVSWCLAIQSWCISISLRVMPRYSAIVQLQRWSHARMQDVHRYSCLCDNLPIIRDRIYTHF